MENEKATDGNVPDRALERWYLRQLAKRARSARGDRRVYELAAEAGVSPQAIYKVESAGGDITVSTARALAAALGVDLGWLLRGNRLCPTCDEVVDSRLTSDAPHAAVGG